MVISIRVIEGTYFGADKGMVGLGQEVGYCFHLKLPFYSIRQTTFKTDTLSCDVVMMFESNKYHLRTSIGKVNILIKLISISSSRGCTCLENKFKLI